MSCYLQDRICYVAQSQVYEESRETLQEMLGVDVCEKQIERVSHCYGQLLEEDSVEKDVGGQIAVRDDQIVYAMADGSMVLTREDSWKEIKLGRVFTEVSRHQVSEKRHRISESIYSAHLGNYKQFLSKWEKEIPLQGRLVFLADGAKWFWEWASKNYPAGLQILDYYHCKEYLCQFASAYFPGKEKQKKWIIKQEKRLFKDKVDKVIKEIQKLPLKKAADSANKRKILTYFENNRERMYYGSYREKGLLIGSGPIEAAHRNVIQQRLKLAGQRWTKSGVQYIANLRVCRKSQRWNKIIELTKIDRAAA